jgi:Tfp pilus assembly protein PilV
MRTQLLARARHETAGFGMIELLAAMTILVVGLLAVFSMFHSGAIQLQRASTVATTASLADAEMEKLRAVKYAVIGMTSTDVAGADGIHKGDASAYRAPGTNATNEAVTLATSSYSPVQNVTGADGKAYRVDTYVTWQEVSIGCTPGPCTVGRKSKLVTIVVRDPAENRVWARVSSAFDESTGL